MRAQLRTPSVSKSAVSSPVRPSMLASALGAATALEDDPAAAWRGGVVAFSRGREREQRGSRGGAKKRTAHAPANSNGSSFPNQNPAVYLTETTQVVEITAVDPSHTARQSHALSLGHERPARQPTARRGLTLLSHALPPALYLGGGGGMYRSGNLRYFLPASAPPE